MALYKGTDRSIRFKIKNKKESYEDKCLAEKCFGIEPYHTPANNQVFIKTIQCNGGHSEGSRSTMMQNEIFKESELSD